MIRPVTVLCFLFACFSGLYLYQCKHRSQLLDREIAHTVRQAELARERAGMLRAEYTLLNDPSRLAELAGKHLTSLRTTAPTQFTNWAELDRRLPPVGAPAGEATPLEPEVTVAKLPDAAAGRFSEQKAEPAAPVAAAPPAPAPVVVPVAPQVAARQASTPAFAMAVPAPSPPQAVPPRPALPRLAAPSRAATGPVSLTASLSVPRPIPANPPAGAAAPVQAAAPARPPVRHLASAPATAASQPAARAYVPPPGSPAEAVASIARGGPVNPSVPAVASALGMARTMMAPTAVSSANAASYWQAGGSQPAGAR